MAYTDFYMQTTANDLNAGSTNADTSVYTSTGGNFDGTSVFTPTDGSTPSSTVSAGMWANFYNTGDTVCRCVAKILSVGAGVNGTITLDTSNKMGTVPTSNSGSRAIKVGGAWKSMLAPQGLGGVTLPTSLRINIKAGNYTAFAASVAVTFTGSAGIISWWRGYTSTPGDLDSVSLASVVAWTVGTTCPAMTTVSTNGLNFAGKDYIISGLAFTSSSTTGPTILISSSNTSIHRCISTNTGAGASSNAIKCTPSSVDISLCYLSATSSAPVILSSSSSAEIRGCYTKGGSNSVSFSSSISILKNVFEASNSDSVSQTGNVVFVFYENSIYGPGGHGISLVSTLTSDVSIIGNIFENITTATKVPVSFGGSTDVGCVRLESNSLYNCNAGTDANTGGLSTGLGDMVAFDTVSEAIDPLAKMASSGHNATYTGSTGLGLGYPAYYQDTDDAVAFTSRNDPGATQHIPSTSSSSSSSSSGGGTVINNILLQAARKLVVNRIVKRQPTILVVNQINQVSSSSSSSSSSGTVVGNLIVPASRRISYNRIVKRAGTVLLHTSPQASSSSSSSSSSGPVSNNPIFQTARKVVIINRPIRRSSTVLITSGIKQPIFATERKVR